MAVTSKIEWTDSTFNPWIGCQHVSPGCDHCYAEAQNSYRKWTPNGAWGPHAERRRTSVATWKNPRLWNADAERFARAHGRRRRVFCASLADWLDNQAEKGWRADLCKLIEETPALDWLLLTKRIENYRKLAPPSWQTEPPRNIWLGFTAEDTEHYRKRWQIAAAIPAAVHFVSYEPAIGPLDLGDGPVPDWIIAGGESGPKARAMGAQWARDIRDQCQGRGVAFFFKQWGTYASNPMPAAEDPPTNGKGGGLVDGRLWRDFPNPLR